MSHFTTVWLKENQVRLVGSYRSFTCIYRYIGAYTVLTSFRRKNIGTKIF